MSKGFVGALSLLLAGAGLAFAQSTPPAQSAEQTAPAGAATPSKASVPVVVEGHRSPYWPTNCGPVDQGKPDTCGKEQGCDVPECLWASAEYLVWWVRSGPVPVPLVTTSGAASLGVLGNPDTGVLVGGNEIQYRATSGARFTLGSWLDPIDQWGVEGSGFFFERRNVTNTVNSSATGTPVLARPFINAINGTESSLLISSPGQFFGSVNIGSTNLLYGFETNLVKGIYTDRELKLELIAGFRYMHLEEELGIIQNSTLLPGGSTGFLGNVVLPPGTLGIVDQFQSFNDFYGGQLGARAEFTSGRWSLNARGKIALGTSHEVVRISGGTQLANTGDGNPAQSLPGGLLAVSSNIGRLTNDTFAVIPELGFNVGYQICPHIKLFAGYTFIYWSEVVRPGDHVSRTVNPTTIPSSQAFGVAVGPAAPLAALQRSDYWAQGLNFGMEFRY